MHQPKNQLRKPNPLILSETWSQHQTTGSNLEIHFYLSHTNLNLPSQTTTSEMH